MDNTFSTQPAAPFHDHHSEVPQASPYGAPESPSVNPAAAAAEARGETDPVPFEHAGVAYSILPSTQWPFAAIESFEKGHVAAFLLAVIPEEHHAALRALKVSDLQDLMPAAQRAAGIPGN